jgi:16S rRNA (cytosine967-C5)-methyltransferase
MKNRINVRSLAAQIIEQVIDKQRSLTTLLPDAQKQLHEKDSALLQELCFGVVRYLPLLERLINALMKKPLTGKQRVLHYLLMVGIYQLVYTRIPAHAILAETVEGAAILKKQNLKSLINAVLRQFQRECEHLLTKYTEQSENILHPTWLVKRLKTAYPLEWQTILQANNQRPPMWLRVNRQYHSRTQWLRLLQQETGSTAVVSELAQDALCLDIPLGVKKLPGFSEGWITVQDLSAQRCALFLAPQDDDSILDLCAAPGGKTTHILEIAPQAKVTAVDIDAARLKRVHENLARLNCQATVLEGDGRYPEQWCQVKNFDRILLDAPCSATGVIRRHPDIKWLRRDTDIALLAKLQSEILDAIWAYLKPSGILIYSTCSILPEENQQQISNFLLRQQDAIAEPLQEGMQLGLQVLPDSQGGDGFFYAKLRKSIK